MLKYRPRHPATLQAVRQWHLRVQQQELIKTLPGPQLAPLCDHNYNTIRPHPEDMRIGFEAAIEEYQDPAVGMQHLLVCMYGKLVVRLLHLISLRPLGILYLPGCMCDTRSRQGNCSCCC